MHENVETSEDLEKVRKFSSEGHAVPILRRVRVTAAPRRGCHRSRGAALAATAAAATAAAATEKWLIYESEKFLVGKVPRML